jgi:hypothetical protein
MKKSLLLLSAAFTMLAATLSAQYDATTWTGAWIMNASSVQNYIIFDGVSAMTEAGVPGATGTQGSYAVSGATTSGTIVYGGSSVSFSGTLTTDSTFSGLVMGALPVTFTKVKNVAIMAGTYDGSVTQTSGGSATQTVNFTVDINGNITSSSNLTGPISGKLYYSNGKVSGLLKSGEAAPFTEIEFNLTSGYSGGNSLIGSGTLTGNKTATFSITKSSSVSVKNASAIQFNAYPNPAKDQFVIEGAVTNGAIKIYDILGNQLMNTTITSSKTILNVSTLSKGVYFYNITSGTAVSAGKFIVE